MSVDGAAVTSAEAARYRAAGWWSDATLSDCVRRNAASSPDKPAYIDFSLDSADHQLTWSEFDRAATNLAHDLCNLGVGPGDRVALWHKDSAAIHVALVAIERCGAAAVGLGSPRRCPRGRADPADHPALVVDQRHRAATSLPGRPPIRRFASLRLGAELAVDTGAPPDANTSLSPAGADDVFLINSTSGTTGMPKCVVHTQNRWHYFHQKAVANGELTGDDVFLPVIPTPYGFGIWTSHTTPIHLGATTVRIERFDPAATCAAIERHRATVLCCVSTQLAMILADPHRGSTT